MLLGFGFGGGGKGGGGGGGGLSEERGLSLLPPLKSGGLELLFESKKKHEVDVSPTNGHKELTMESLLVWIRENILKERPEMFMKENSVRPGVLVLVNDSDWELCGRLETVLEENDEVIFISTLHGG